MVSSSSLSCQHSFMFPGKKGAISADSCLILDTVDNRELIQIVPSSIYSLGPKIPPFFNKSNVFRKPFLHQQKPSQKAPNTKQSSIMQQSPVRLPSSQPDRRSVDVHSTDLICDALLGWVPPAGDVLKDPFISGSYPEVESGSLYKMAP